MCFGRFGVGKIVCKLFVNGVEWVGSGPESAQKRGIRIFRGCFFALRKCARGSGKRGVGISDFCVFMCGCGEGVLEAGFR